MYLVSNLWAPVQAPNTRSSTLYLPTFENFRKVAIIMRVTVKELKSGILVEFDKSFAIVRKENGSLISIGDKLPDKVKKYLKKSLKPTIVYL